jgi:hypothetical protein
MPYVLGAFVTYNLYYNGEMHILCDLTDGHFDTAVSLRALFLILGEVASFWTGFKT